MADYAKLNVEFIQSENSDYSSPVIKRVLSAFEITPDEVSHKSKLEVPSTGSSTVDLGNMTAVTLLLIKNHSADYSVNLTHSTSNDSGVITNIAAGGVFSMTDVVIADDLSLNCPDDGQTVTVEMFICGT